MSILKLALFIILTVTIIFLSFMLYIDRGANSVGNSPAGAFIVLLVWLVLFVSVLIALIVLVKAPRYYLNTFLALWLLGFAGLLVKVVIETIQEEIRHKQIVIENNEEDILDKAWSTLKDDPKKSYEISISFKSQHRSINRNKTALLLVLYLKGEVSQKAFHESMERNALKITNLLYFFSDNYTPINEEEYLQVFDVLKKYMDKDFYFYEETTFSLEPLIDRGYYKASFHAVKFEEISQHKLDKYLDQALSIKDEYYKKEITKKILLQADIYYQEWNRTYTVTALSETILKLKNEKYFDEYVEVLQHKLLKLVSNKSFSLENWEPYVNQAAQEQFMEMHRLLTDTHPLIKNIPFKITEYYLTEEENMLNHGKENYVLYRNYLTQVPGNITHSHAYTDEPYMLYIDNKLVHEGLTNQYGCMSYKYYGAKNDDVIVLRTFNRESKQAIGWYKLLSDWNSARGFLERVHALGFYCEGAESIEKCSISYFQGRHDLEHTGKYNIESAKKADQLLKEFMDEKWCKDES